MAEHGFTTTFAVDRTPTETFDAITDVRGWWSEEIDGRTDQLGAEGLVPADECFEVCAGAWGFYVDGSLPSLITTGEGRPNGRGRPRLPAEQAAAGQGRWRPAPLLSA